MSINQEFNVIDLVSPATTGEAASFGTSAPSLLTGNKDGDTFFVTPDGTKNTQPTAAFRWDAALQKWVKHPGSATSVSKAQLDPVLTILTSAQQAALTPEDGDQYIISDGAHKGDIARWSASTGTWSYYVPKDGDETTLTASGYFVATGTYRYDLASDTWILVEEAVVDPGTISRGGWGNIRFPTQIISSFKDAGFMFICNDSVAAWGGDGSSPATYTVGALNQGDASLKNYPRKMSWNWNNLKSGLMTNEATYAPKFVDVAGCEYFNVALDSDGGVWTQALDTNTGGLTTTVAGGTLVSLAPSYAFHPVPFFHQQGIKGARIFTTPIANNNAVNGTIGVLTASGDLYLWGHPASVQNNANGQLGQGNTNVYTSWVKYPIGNVVDVKMQNGAVTCLTNAGSLYFSGLDQYGITGVVGNKTTPVLLATNVKQYDLGGWTGHTIILLKNDGTVWNGGLNDRNQLGRNGTTASPLAQVATGASYIAIDSSNAYRTAYVTTAGDVYWAGANSNGQFATTTPAVGSNTANAYVKSTLGDLGFKGVVKRLEIGSVTAAILTTTGKLYMSGAGQAKGIGSTDQTGTDSNKWVQVPVPTVIDFKLWDSAWDNAYVLTDRGVFTITGGNAYNSWSGSNAAYRSPSYVPLAKIDNGIALSALPAMSI